MEGDPSESLYTIVIMSLKGEAARAKVARTLVRITRNLPMEKIVARLESLPWTLTRRATQKTAFRMVQLLEKAGAVVKVLPPLPAMAISEIEQTQILPDTKLLSETQVSTATQYMKVPAETTRTPRPLGPPPTLPPLKPIDHVNDPQAEEGLQIEPLTLAGILDRTFQICRSQIGRAHV